MFFSVRLLGQSRQNLISNQVIIEINFSYRGYDAVDHNVLPHMHELIIFHDYEQWFLHILIVSV